MIREKGIIQTKEETIFLIMSNSTPFLIIGLRKNFPFWIKQNFFPP